MSELFKDKETKLVFRHMGPNPGDGHIGAGFLEKEENDSHIDALFDHYALVVLLDGEGVYELEGARFNLSAGSVFQRIPGELHSSFVNSNSGWYECFLSLSAPLYKVLSNMDFFNNPGRVFSIPVTSHLISNIQALVDELEIAESYELPALLGQSVSIIENIHALSLEIPDHDLKGRMDKAKKLLAMCITSTDKIDYVSIAGTIGLSYSSFRVTIQDYTPKSPA